VNRILGGREIRPSDVEDILCGLRDAPKFDEDPVANMRIDEAASSLRQEFHTIVIFILGRKEQDEREHQTGEIG